MFRRTIRIVWIFVSAFIVWTNLDRTIAIFRGLTASILGGWLTFLLSFLASAALFLLLIAIGFAVIERTMSRKTEADS